MFFIYFKGSCHNGVFLCHRELQHWHKSLVLYWAQLGWVFFSEFAKCIFFCSMSISDCISVRSEWGSPQDGSFHPAVELKCCLPVLISGPHSDEIAVIMCHGYSNQNASFGSRRSSPLLGPFLAIVCIPSAWLGRGFPGFGFLWLSMLSSLSRLSKSLISFQTKGGQ